MFALFSSMSIRVSVVSFPSAKYVRLRDRMGTTISRGDTEKSSTDSGPKTPRLLWVRGLIRQT